MIVKNRLYFFELSIFCFLIMIFSMLTFLRNNVWEDESALWTDICLKSPHKIRPHVNVGNEYVKRGRIDEAIEKYKMAISLNYKVNYAKTFFNLGVAYQKKRDYQEAIIAYNRAIHLKPDFWEAIDNLGTTYREMGDIELAIATYKKIVRLNPKFPYAYYNLGAVYKQEGKWEEAITEYQTYLNYCPADINALLKIASCYQRLGSINDALHYLTKAYRIDPKNKRVAASIKNIMKDIKLKEAATENE